MFSFCGATWWVLGWGETRDEKDFINTINSGAQVPSIFSERRLSQAKWMIALSRQNINRVKISQWFRELYSSRRSEKITRAPKGAEDSETCRVYLYQTYGWGEYSGPTRWAQISSLRPVLFRSASAATPCSQSIDLKENKGIPDSCLDTLFHTIYSCLCQRTSGRLQRDASPPHYTNIPHCAYWQEMRWDKTLRCGK